jgi:hypothetical protein
VVLYTQLMYVCLRLSGAVASSKAAGLVEDTSQNATDATSHESRTLATLD